MTGDDASDNSPQTTVFIHNHPLLDFFIIGVLSIFFTIMSVMFVSFGWQMLTQEEADIAAVIVGGALGLGTFLAIPRFLD